MTFLCTVAPTHARVSPWEHVPQLGLVGVPMASAGLGDVADFDCVVITTNHSGVDYRTLVSKAQLAVDTRNATREFRTEFPERIVTL